MIKSSLTLKINLALVILGLGIAIAWERREVLGMSLIGSGLTNLGLRFRTDRRYREGDYGTKHNNSRRD